MFGTVRTLWTNYQRRRTLRQLRDSMAFYGFSLSAYSDAELAEGMSTMQIARTSCTTASEAAFLFQQIKAGVEAGDDDTR